MENILKELKFDEKGLIPAVVQDSVTKEVLMVAYMTAETLEMTLKTKKATFFSRSRNEVWVKGETSGHTLDVESVKVDCDGDCLVVFASPNGPACHTNNRSCFFRTIRDGELVTDTKQGGTSDILMREQAVIIDRKKNPEDDSYTNYLFNKGEDKILKKVGEESTEVIIGGKANDKAETVYEIADLMYHVMVLMVEMGISIDDIMAELASRHVIDHKVKQEKMTK